MIYVYGIKNCDSVKKALTFFKKHDLEYELFDFKEKSLPCEKISTWLTQTEMKTLFNARSTTYRTLKIKEQNPTEEEKKDWLCKENMLIKRPVVESQGQLLVGYNEDTYKGVFL